jgi:hypothetical protein
MSETTNNVFFARKEWPEKARNVLTFDCYYLNPARTRTLSVLPGPGQSPCRPLVVVNAVMEHIKSSHNYARAVHGEISSTRCKIFILLRNFQAIVFLKFWKTISWQLLRM